MSALFAGRGGGVGWPPWKARWGRWRGRKEWRWRMEEREKRKREREMKGDSERRERERKEEEESFTLGQVDRTLSFMLSDFSFLV